MTHDPLRVSVDVKRIPLEFEIFRMAVWKNPARPCCGECGEKGAEPLRDTADGVEGGLILASFLVSFLVVEEGEGRVDERGFEASFGATWSSFEVRI